MVIQYPYLPTGRSFIYVDENDPFMREAKVWAKEHSQDKQAVKRLVVEYMYSLVKPRWKQLGNDDGKYESFRSSPYTLFPPIKTVVATNNNDPKATLRGN